MTSLSESIIHSYKSGRLINNSVSADVTYAEAITLQQTILAELGKDVGGYKIIIHPNDGLGAVAPMFADRCVLSGDKLAVSAAGLLCFELELAVVLKADITKEMALGGIDALKPAISHSFFGLEIVTTRFQDQKSKSIDVQLADNLSNGAYVSSEQAWAGDLDIDGLDYEIFVNGESVLVGFVKHPFGHPLKPIMQYALRGDDVPGALKAGTMITTGSFCGGVPITTPSSIKAVIAKTHVINVEIAA